MGKSKETLFEEDEQKPAKVDMQKFPWLRVAFFILVLFVVILPFTSVPERLRDCAVDVVRAKRESTEKTASEPKKEGEIDHPKVESEAVQIAANVLETTERPSSSNAVIPSVIEKPIPKKEHFVGTKGDVIRMSKGFHFDYAFETEKGEIASVERNAQESYVAQYTLKVTLPKPSSTLEELTSVNPQLPTILPGIEALLESAKVSDFYYTLYENKVKRLKRSTLKLAELSTKHNFYDCETILNLTHPTSGRKVLLMQGDMDVVSDGSDGDRLPAMPAAIVNSTHYQPFTSYGWKKQTRKPNPMVAGWKKRIGNAKREIADSVTTADRKAWLKARVKKLKRGIEDMKARSYLIAEYDPFIVMPVNMIRDRSDTHAARVGDYAVVIVGDKVYPAIVGDGGPTFKVGEGSLRLAKQINERASPYSRPVSDLTVTYLVFSGSRETVPRAPDYDKWHDKCATLLHEIGGLGAGFTLHRWEDKLTPKKTVEEPTTPEATNSSE